MTATTAAPGPRGSCCSSGGCSSEPLRHAERCIHLGPWPVQNRLVGFVDQRPDGGTRSCHPVRISSVVSWLRSRCWQLSRAKPCLVRGCDNGEGWFPESRVTGADPALRQTAHIDSCFNMSVTKRVEEVGVAIASFPMMQTRVWYGAMAFFGAPSSHATSRQVVASEVGLLFGADPCNLQHPISLPPQPKKSVFNLTASGPGS